MNKYYVYEHSLDGRIFYVGHGCGNRAWNVKSRSNRYKNYIKERYDDIEVTIVQDNLTKEQAMGLEVEHQIKRQDEGYNIIGLLGTHSWNEGIKMSDDFKQKVSKGTKKAMNTPEMKAKMSSIRKGKQLSEAHKAAISDALRGQVHSEEAKRNMSISKKKYYEEAKRTGKNVGWSKEHRENYYKSIERRRQQKQIV